MYRFFAIFLTLLVSLEIAAKEDTLTRESAKKSVCDAMITEFQKFGTFAASSNKAGTYYQSEDRVAVSFIHAELLAGMESASAIYKNLDCDNVRK